MEYDLKKRFEKIVESNHLKVKSKIQFLLAINNVLEYKDLRNSIDTSKNWLDNVLNTLSKNKVIGFKNTEPK